MFIMKHPAQLWRPVQGQSLPNVSWGHWLPSGHIPAVMPFLTEICQRCPQAHIQLLHKNLRAFHQYDSLLHPLFLCRVNYPYQHVVLGI